jgi:methionine--tRNA ligase beta chain
MKRRTFGCTVFLMLTPAPIKPVVDFAVLDSIDIRIGTIQAVDEVPGSRKLVKMTVSFGDRTRSILAGLKQERADLATLVGRQTLFVVNLAPRTMAGEMSEGMLLDVGYADGIVPAMLLPERPVPDGCRA